MGTSGQPAWRLPGLLLLAAGNALAAGGHHGVDDAVILGRGDCEQESWVSRGHDERLLHLGVGCRVGPVELGVAAERGHSAGDSGSSTAWNLEVKWAREVAEGFSVGFDVQPVWSPQSRPRFEATRFAALATWSPRTELALHLNLGRDFVRGDTDLAHHGVAVDWTPIPRWTLTLERFLEERTHFARAGVRWAGGHIWTVDFSRAQRLSGPGASNWTVGLTLDLDED